MTNGEAVKLVRNWLIENIFRNGNIMHDQRIREAPGIVLNDESSIDLAEVISGLYEILHAITYDESYDYMFHWANKCGSWVESDFFVKMIKEKEKENGKDSEA